ncbi:MAG: TonB-dependent receptor [Bacteroidota bacterium]
MKQYSFTFLFLFLTLLTYAQTSIIRGTIVDQQTKMPLIGATIQLTKNIGTVSDVDGKFRLENIPVGRNELMIAYLGYDSRVLPNVMVTSGKEVILDIELEETLVRANEVVVTAEAPKDGTTNALATISARSFNMEEVSRYAGGRQDPARLVANYAGVSTSDDARNDIVIRGNSPTGVQWRLQGIPIPNPNHYAALGTTGGPVTALNNNLLKDSDFLTSAFPAEYGNATAGVFDLRLRQGNDEKYEFTGQIGFNGFEAMAEGPMKLGEGSSFLASYRYSVIGLIGSFVDIGTSGIPKYQDLSFTMDLGKTPIGRFSIFGMGGISDIAFFADEAEEGDFYAQDSEDTYAGSDIGVIGVKHNLILNNSTYWQSTLGVSASRSRIRADEFTPTGEKFAAFENTDLVTTHTLSSFINKKFNARHTLRTGILLENYDFNLSLEDKNDGIWETIRDFDGNTQLLQAYAQSQYKLSSKWTLNTGIHAQLLTLNNDFVLEPRVAINWNIQPKHQLNIGYGLHHQLQPFPIYFYESPTIDGGLERTNEDLKFNRSQHFVVGYDWKVAKDWRLKAETYYQDLSNIAVDAEPSSFSVLNTGSDFGFPEAANLVNEGSGRNYGVELTLEKFFSQDYYGLFTLTLYDSKYTGSDGVERNTAFNNQFVLNFLAGKEFLFGKNKQNAITIDARISTAGGRYFTPIDLEASKQQGREIRIQDQAFGQQFDNYFRADLKLGVRFNAKKVAHTFSVDLQNMLNTENPFSVSYSPSSERIVTTNQLGFFPNVTYVIQL